MLILLIVIIVVVIAVATSGESASTRKWKEEQVKRKKEKNELERARLLLLLMEVRRQAEAVGDIDTINATDNMTYNGPVPERRDDGAFLSMYDNLRIFKIAGMKYRGNLSPYLGSFKGMIIPEPSNEYDKFAIMVKCEDGKHIGYIREDQTQTVRWLVGAEQSLGEETPTEFNPYRISGYIEEKTDEMDEHKYYDGWVYIKKNN